MPNPPIFDPDQDRTLLRLFREGLSMRRMARELHVDISTISRAINRACEVEKAERKGESA